VRYVSINQLDVTLNRQPDGDFNTDPTGIKTTLSFFKKKATPFKYRLEHPFDCHFFVIICCQLSKAILTVNCLEIVSFRASNVLSNKSFRVFHVLTTSSVQRVICGIFHVTSTVRCKRRNHGPIFQLLLTPKSKFSNKKFQDSALLCR
jgi:hypothetical protein